jgi:hypothetical protein
MPESLLNVSLTILDLKVAQAYSLVSEDNKKNCQLRKLGYIFFLNLGLVIK